MRVNVANIQIVSHSIVFFVSFCVKPPLFDGDSSLPVSCIQGSGEASRRCRSGSIRPGHAIARRPFRKGSGTRTLLHAAPQPLDEDVVQGTATAVHADGDAVVFQQLHIVPPWKPSTCVLPCSWRQLFLGTPRPSSATRWFCTAQFACA